jgi:membrane protease YdiL (CAAX protease family)
MEILDEGVNPYTPPQLEEDFPPKRPEMSPWAVLGLFLLMVLAGNIIASIIMMSMTLSQGQDLGELIKSLSEDTPIGTRNFMRSILFLNHLFTFIIPAIATAWIAYRNQWFSYLKFDKAPQLKYIILGFLWLFFSVPLVQYAYQINKMLPLPQWMIEMENSTAGMLDAIISKENFYEIIINVILIAVIPGIGEEMAFRGILQQQLGRWIKNEHLMVWIAAAIFSAIHMQFQGFFARMLLGALLGYLFVWTRSLWIPAIVHFLNNGLQVISIYALNIKPSESEQVTGMDKMPWYAAVASLLLAIGIGFYIKKLTDDDLKEEKLQLNKTKPTV